MIAVGIVIGTSIRQADQAEVVSRPRLGDIGPVRRRVDLEPMPESVPITEPAPVVTPEPVREPVPTR